MKHTIAILGTILLVVGTPTHAQRLDPDTRWDADQWQHAAGGALLDGVLHLPLFPKGFRDTRAKRLLAVLVVGCVAFEAGQADASRDRSGPGYGFGLLDCAAVMAGALVTEGFVALFRASRDGWLQPLVPGWD